MFDGPLLTSISEPSRQKTNSLLDCSLTQGPRDVALVWFPTSAIELLVTWRKDPYSFHALGDTEHRGPRHQPFMPLSLFAPSSSSPMPLCAWLPLTGALYPVFINPQSKETHSPRLPDLFNALSWSIFGYCLFFFSKEPNSGLYLRHPTMDTELYPGAFSPKWLLVIQSPEERGPVWQCSNW